MRKTTRHLMLIPSSACPAQCAYCFGPRAGVVMSEATLVAVLDWIEATTLPHQALDVTLHGGEPLHAGLVWHRRALTLLRARFGKRLRLSLQSNLWLLNDAFCDLFREYNVSLGVSLDGPETINDVQRGAGYFAHTMRGIETARRHGLNVGVICTFTRLSTFHWREVCDFFQREGLSFSVHGVIPTLGLTTSQTLSLTADEYADLFIAMFDYYLENIRRIRIPTFDQMSRGVAGNCSICTFSPCLGRYLTIASDGGIYPCNRFTPHIDWRIGTVQPQPTLEELAQTLPWQRLQRREAEVQQDCSDCPYFANCSGGCAYHALAASADRRDGFCAAYKRVFAHITEMALTQVFSEENLAAVVESGADNKRGLLHKGPLLQIMSGGVHPTSTINRAQEAVASVALAASASPAEAFEKLNHVGLITQPERAHATLQGLWQRLHHPPRRCWSEAYIHVTYACNLACSHCYASSCPTRSAEFMSIAQIRKLVQALIAASFRSVKITGGEPLMHPHWPELQGMLIALRRDAYSSRLVLRTNLTKPLSPAELHALAQSVDHIIVSVDGDQASHDKLRGSGAYTQTTANLRALAQLKSAAHITLAATLTPTQWHSAAGQSVRALATELNFDVRVRPVLPLGRAASLSLQPEFDFPPSDAVEAINHYGGARASCSLGHNLHIAVDGACYPCFALMGADHFLGNVLGQSLDAVLERNTRYMQYTVDTNLHCRQCVWRYLCGGLCRVWSHDQDPDAPPQNCVALQRRAASILRGALDILKVLPERCQMAGLPYNSNQ